MWLLPKNSVWRSSTIRSKAYTHKTYHLPRNCRSVSGSAPRGQRLSFGGRLQLGTETQLSSVIFPPLLQARQHPELVVPAHCLNCLGIGWVVGRQNFRLFGHQCLSISELIQADCRLQAIGNPLPRDKGNRSTLSRSIVSGDAPLSCAA